MNKRIALSLVPLIIGGLLYFPFRTGNIIFLQFFSDFPQETFGITKKGNAILDWIIYSLPDALWILSFTYLMLSIWDFRVTKQSSFWIIVAPAIGIGYEIGQLTGNIGGTYDIMDLLSMIIASGIPLIHFLLTQKQLTYVKN